MNVAVYTRVSTKHEEQFTSLENQKKIYSEYCSKNNYNLVKLYSDEGLSATSPKRKGFLEMIHDAGLDYFKDNETNEILYFKESEREPRFELIITKDVSRFSRNIDSMALVKKLKNKGVYILFENAGFSTNDNDWELRLSLLLTFSQQESLDRAKKVAWSYANNSKSGKYHLSRNLYGYSYNKETKEIHVIEEQAKVVKKMFDLYINEGYGMKAISKYLNDNRIYTQNNKEWTPLNVRRILRNEKYIGRVILNRYTNNGITSGKKRIERPKNEWVILEGINPATNKPYIEPIIDMETWDKAQKIVNQRIDQTKEGSLTGTRKVKNEFYNKLFCGYCGRPFVRVSATKKRKTGKITQILYSCSNRRLRNSCDNKMVSHNVLVKKIKEFAEKELSQRLNDKRKLLEKVLNIEQKMWKTKLITSQKTINKVQNRISEIDIEKDKLINAFLKGNSPIVSVIENKIAELENEKSDLNQKILEHDPIAIKNKLAEIDETFDIMKTTIKDEYTYEEALKYIGKITYKNGDIQFRVVIGNDKLEPNESIDMERLNNASLDNAIEYAKEMIDIVKGLKKQ